jgi:hypothetical protein
MSLISMKRGMFMHAAARALISQYAFVESGMPTLYSCATPVIANLGVGGGRQAENPIVPVVDGAVSIHAHPHSR